MLALLAFAHATEPAFTCDALDEPADGLAYADVGARSDSVFDRIVAAIQAEFEPGCPRMCDTGWGGLPPGDCYADDCVTAAGTHVVVDYRREADTGTYAGGSTETWDATVEAASGETLALTSAYTSDWGRGGGHGYDGDVAWSWSASWTGEVDTELPADRSLVVERASSVSSDALYDWYTSDESEAWDDGVCVWSAAESHSYWPTYPARTSWGFVVGAQTLTVGEATTGCDAALVRRATLDGVTTEVVDPDWTPLVDADGDGADASVDCDDADAARSPCVDEVASDGVDNDCDGVEAVDADGDGAWSVASGGGDCDDADAAIGPSAEEVACDGVDQDCDGADDTDGDDDGYDGAACGGDDCDDAATGTHPGARDEVGDAVDQDCDGLDGHDADEDGYASVPSGGDDCRDGDADVHPGAADVPCDGQDQDCDGADAPCDSGDTGAPPDTDDTDDTDTGAGPEADDTGAAPPPDAGCGGGCGSGAGALLALPLLFGRRRR